MNKEFMKSLMKVAIFEKKADTKTSYYIKAGETPLPSRLSIDLSNVFTTSANKGRMVSGDMVIGEIRGEFRKSEVSALKQNPPFKVSSKIFRKTDFPQLLGYGTLAISNEEGRTCKEEGVVIFVDMGVNLLKIFFIAGKCIPDLILNFCELVSEELKKERQP